ncbi:MAG: peptidase and in, kexin, sedolisin [Bryobacterales bacterium]|nr:peptidase and in, kexin, sedolisin [Bryobacterales bacterium]
MVLFSRFRYARATAISGLLLTAFLALNLMAQRSRLDGPIKSRERVSLTGHTRSQVRPENDEGPADSSMVLDDMSIVLKPSAAQQAELDQLLREQQDPSSANYHRWLSPDEYAQRFGASPGDLGRITDWLKQQNLEVTGVARARNSIQFRGTAQAVGAAFATQIRNYRVNGRRHYANATNPSVPADLDLMVAAIEGLDDFHLEPRGVRARAETLSVEPNYTSSSGRHYLAPDDLATIYNVKPLYAAGIDGSGQTIVVAGQTQMDLADVRTFRARFGLSAVDPETLLVPGSRDPGISSGDVDEANLDLQWAGAVARNARILYVYSSSVMNAVRYAIDQNLGSAISVSYGSCELQTSAASLRAFQTWARQANAQGMTWVNASGDSGGADCASGSSGAGGLAVDAPASVPEVTGIGGTTLQEDGGTYWNASNGTNDASVLSYIPETAWNDSTAGSPASGGGGASSFFLKPSWQTGAGVPNDGARSVPDISLAASANHNGYMVYTGGTLVVFGGTSAGTPVFAGMVALLNQYLARGGDTGSVGNVNPRLYSLAQSAPNAFHDVTSGSNTVSVTCAPQARSCSPGSYGYDAGPGYDLATGLGSVNLYNMVTGWKGPVGSLTPGTANMTLTSSAASIGASDSVTLTASVASANGGVPLGTVAFRIAGVLLGTANLIASTNKSVATWNVTGASLSAGSNTISAEYSGNAAYAGATASTTVTVAQGSSGPPAISGFTNAASFRTSYAPGMLLSVFGSQLAPAAWSATSVPLPSQMAGVSVTINGVTAPLLYVSPSLLNIQIPYEIGPDTLATVIVNNNGRTATGSLTVGALAPGIFVDSNFAPIPNATGTRGQIITLYITGAGAITPQVATGGAPDQSTAVSNLPQPLAALNVTVGGLPAAIQFAGIPWGLVGVMQINYQIPEGVPLGTNPVLVQIGNVSSAAANLTVTQ